MVDSLLYIDESKICNYWEKSVSLILCAVVKHCENDSWLTKQLTNLCGNIWQRSLLSQRAERNEFYYYMNLQDMVLLFQKNLQNKKKLNLVLLKVFFYIYLFLMSS